MLSAAGAVAVGVTENFGKGYTVHARQKTKTTALQEYLFNGHLVGI